MNERERLRLSFKIVGSIVLVGHLFAVVLAPASVPPTTSLVRNCHEFFRPYLQFAFLNHGYHFFAPDPGSSSLIEYTVIREDGERIWGRLPDRKTHWPRLLYHRHFMLTEFYGAIPEYESELRETLAAAYAQQLLKENSGTTVELSHVLHFPASRAEVIEGRQLDDPVTYEIRPIGQFQLQSNATTPAIAFEPPKNNDEAKPLQEKIQLAEDGAL